MIWHPSSGPAPCPLDHNCVRQPRDSAAWQQRPLWFSEAERSAVGRKGCASAGAYTVVPSMRAKKPVHSRRFQQKILGEEGTRLHLQPSGDVQVR